MSIGCVHYNYLADLFHYPTKNLVLKTKELIKVIPLKYKRSANELSIFHNIILLETLSSMEEIYIKTFDIQSATTLNIGYVLFGDDYKRGEILAGLNQEYRKSNIDCGNELGDYLPNILYLISKNFNSDFIFELVKNFLGPALRKMIAEFSEGNVDKRDNYYRKRYKTIINDNKKNIFLYEHLLLSLYYMISDDFDVTQERRFHEKSGGFLSSLKEELKTEEKNDNYFIS